jgi:hypothetical protein
LVPLSLPFITLLEYSNIQSVFLYPAWTSWLKRLRFMLIGMLFIWCCSYVYRTELEKTEQYWKGWYVLC